VSRLVITGFSGANLALTPRLLPDGVGVSASNIKRTRGDLRPWAAPLAVATVPSSPARKTIYRMGRDVASDANYWLSWPTVVDVIRHFNPEDTTERTIFTGSGTPKWTNNVIGLAGAPYPTATRELGVPPPSTTHIVTINTDGPDGTAEDVFTIVTFVNDIDEEGAGGPVSAKVTVKPGAILNVSSLPAAPSGAYGITKRRIYATKVGGASTDFFLAKEVPISTSSTTINLSDLNDAWQTADYDMPPAAGHSLTELWQGMAAMIDGKAVRLCEAFTIYAWPEAYKLPVGDKPVGLGVYDQTLLVLTTGRPYIISGQTPDAMSLSPIELDQSCVSKQSIVSFGFAVVWASPDGLYVMTNGGPRNLLDNVVTRDDWQALVPSTIIGCRYEGYYFGFYNDGSKKGFIVDPRDPQGITFLSTGYDAAFRDSVTDAMYVVAGGSVQKWDAGATPMTATFKSKVFRQARPTLFTCAQVIADTFNNVTVKVYADGVLKKTKTVTDGKPFRLPQGYRATEWQVEVSTQSPITAVILGESMQDLDG
jgi:hypothetical protein